jgi:hypothetical protein
MHELNHESAQPNLDHTRATVAICRCDFSAGEKAFLPHIAGD